jgi:hypothetical protein
MTGFSLDPLSQLTPRLRADVEASNARFGRWGGRLWGITLGLVVIALTLF